MKYLNSNSNQYFHRHISIFGYALLVAKVLPQFAYPFDKCDGKSAHCWDLVLDSGISYNI